MKKIILLLLLMPFMGVAQEKGIHFEHGLSWEQVKEKAKKEHKYLFVDCFTTWCGPCKKMSMEVFTQEQVGTFFNQNFVNVKMQLDKTKADSEEIKKGYADAEMIKNSYKISVYPTFLIFSPEGELIHRMVGSSDAEEFIKRTQEALNPETQYYALVKKYKDGNRNPAFLKQMIFATRNARDKENGEKVLDDYLDTQDDVFTIENLNFIYRSLQSSKSKSFQLLLNNQKKANEVWGEEKANEILSRVILKEDYDDQVDRPNVNADSLLKTVKLKYPTVDLQKSIDAFEIWFSQRQGKWNEFGSMILPFMEKYSNGFNADYANSYAWSVFQNFEDPVYTTAALGWSKRLVEKTEGKNATFVNTYANLLYKAGKKEEAIAMQKKAVEMATEEEKPAYQAMLNKMKKGEKTWLEQ